MNELIVYTKSKHERAFVVLVTVTKNKIKVKKAWIVPAIYPWIAEDGVKKWWRGLVKKYPKMFNGTNIKTSVMKTPPLLQKLGIESFEGLGGEYENGEYYFPTLPTLEELGVESFSEMENGYLKILEAMCVMEDGYISIVESV